MLPFKFRQRLVISLLMALAALTFQVATASSGAKGMVVRLRLVDGSMEKVVVPDGAEEKTTLQDILQPFELEGKSISVQVGTDTVKDMDSSLSALNVRHGSIITIKSTSPKKEIESRFSQLKVDRQQQVWSPFPDLAKDYQHALLKTKTRRSSSKGMSYGDIARLQSSLHVVEPQSEGPLKRLYMCQKAAERFQAQGLPKKKASGGGGALPRVGLLLGTIQKERVDKSPRKARTSLSSQTSDADFCTVAKVQAVWEPPSQKPNGGYDTTIGASLLTRNQRVLVVARNLGLVPVGWIYSYTDGRHEDEDSLPVYGLDVQIGATLQITNMKPDEGLSGKENVDERRLEGKNFATLAMDANTGATEAFQLSDVSIQMVHEDMLVLKPNAPAKRMVQTKHEVLVDGRETKELDSVLCLINTAMLSHIGSYSGKTAASSTKKSGALTNKTKKLLVKLLEEKADRKLLEELCDFGTLLALDAMLNPEESEIICQTVRKWARGQKQGTTVDTALKRKLLGVLQT